MEELLKLFMGGGGQHTPQPIQDPAPLPQQAPVQAPPGNVLNQVGVMPQGQQPQQQQSAFQNMQSMMHGNGAGNTAFGGILKLLGM